MINSRYRKIAGFSLKINDDKKIKFLYCYELLCHHKKGHPKVVVLDTQNRLGLNLSNFNTHLKNIKPTQAWNKISFKFNQVNNDNNNNNNNNMKETDIDLEEFYKKQAYDPNTAGKEYLAAHDYSEYEILLYLETHKQMPQFRSKCSAVSQNPNQLVLQCKVWREHLKRKIKIKMKKKIKIKMQ